MPTQTKENYLKAVYFLNQKKGVISITDLAKIMSVSKPTANNMVKKLMSNDWVIYEKYKPLELTDNGKKIGALIVRKHRLTEMFLTEVMGFGWEEVHDIAEEMEHLNSEKLFDRMDEILGFPTTDPHGSPIPDKNGKVFRPNYLNLTKIKEGEKVNVRALTRSSKDLLLFLNKKEIKLGTEIEILQIENFDKSVEIKLNNKINTVLSFDVCQCLLVEKID